MSPDDTGPLSDIFSQDEREALKQELEENHIDINAVDEGGDTALICAARSGDLKGAALVISLGADVNLRSQDEDEETPLLTALANGQPAIARLLVAKGADPNAAGKGGRRPLFGASALGDLQLVEDLLAKGAQAAAADDLNRTALHAACEKGDEKIAAVLLAHGASANAEDDFGLTPLAFAIGRSLDLVRALLDAGADVEGGSALKPLAAAARVEDKATIRLLMERGASLDAKSDGGWSALTIALESGNREIVDLLLQCDVDRRLKAKEAERQEQKDRADRAAFNQAADEGLPLEKPVAVKPPLQLKRPKP